MPGRPMLARLVALALLAAGCGDEALAPEASDAGSRPGSDAGTAELAWQPCAFYTGGTDSNAQCAQVQVPVDWKNPDGPTLSLFVKRLGDYSPKGQQIWFLMGGPGGASAGYESLASQVIGADPTLNVYLLDHRGTGRSDRLGCLVEEGNGSPNGFGITQDEWPACIDSLIAQWGDSLPHFNTTQAATDLGWMIDRTRAPGQRVHVHGGSYGTFWAQRYLQIFPDQPTSVSMLGVVHPTFSFTRYNRQYEDVGKMFLDACADDEFCASKLGAAPEAKLRAVMGDIGGRCPEALASGLDRETIRSFTAAQMLFGWEERVLALALAYRIDRCAPADITALQFFAANMTNPIDGLLSDRLFSTSIGNHIGIGDLWEEPVQTLEDEQALVADALFAFGSTMRFEVAPIWPAYDKDPYHDVFANTDVPILMINGELDPASPLSQALPVGAHFSGRNQHFVTIPGASHSWTSPTTEGYTCATNLFFNFMTDPTAPLLGCASIVEPLSFASTSEMAALFGTADLWENVTATLVPELDPLVQERVRSNYLRALAEH